MAKHQPRTIRSATITPRKWSTALLGSTAAGASALGQTIRFEAPLVYTETGRSSFLATADLNADGAVDLVTSTSSSTIAVFHNDGSGYLLLRTSIPYSVLSSLEAADMDADRDIDLVWFEQLPDRTYVLSVWYNSGDGRTGEIVQTPIPTSAGSRSLVADINGDGFNDVVYASTPRTISALVNDRSRSFTRSELYTYYSSDYHLAEMAAGDLDGDGDVDLAGTFQYTYAGHYYNVKGSQVALLLNDGSGAFAVESETELPWQVDNLAAYDMALGDLDGDGDLDVVVGGGPPDRNFPNEFVMLRNDEGQSLSIETIYRASSGYICSVATSDINTDGRLDLIFVSSNVNGAYVVRNEGGFNFAGQSPFVTNIAGYTLGVADLTGDGQIDLIQGGSSGFATITNITTLRTPRYKHSALRRGQPAAFVVTGAEPGEEVRFLYSGAGAGNSLGYRVLGGITLDVLEPFTQFGVELAGADGRAVLRREIPLNAVLGPVTTQAVIRRGPGGVDSVKTPFRSSVIED